MALIDLFKNLHKAPGQEELQLGRAAEEQKNLEGAYAHYEKAAELGSTEAMVAIGDLYMDKGFRPVKANNLMELLAQGMPVFPWSLVEKEQPDMKAALSWYRKAADAGSTRGMSLAGLLLCDGSAGKPDLTAGMAYLEKAIAKGDARARIVKALFSQPGRRSIPDQQYDAWLQDFQQAVESNAARQYDLYEQLKSGSDAQLTRLGYVLTTARNIGKEPYCLFKYLHAENGMPLIPACYKRANWQSFVRIDLNAFCSADTVLAYSSDIGAEYALNCCHRLEKCGTAVYRSPAFGWLREEKHAVLLRPVPDKPLDAALLEDVIDNFSLIPEEYEPQNAAFFTESGEKEFSVEIAAIAGNQVDVLLRYTVGGSEDVRKYFTPEMISMNLN